MVEEDYKYTLYCKTYAHLEPQKNSSSIMPLMFAQDLLQMRKKSSSMRTKYLLLTMNHSKSFNISSESRELTSLPV